MLAASDLPATPLEPARSSHDDARRPVRRVTEREQAELTSADVAAAWGVFDGLYEGVSRETFERHILRREGRSRVALFAGDDGAYAGFAVAHRELVAFEGSTYAVIIGGAYVDLRFRGGAAVAAFGFREALRHKARNPTHKLAYMAAVMTPAAYRMNLRSLPVLYPNRRAAAPREAEAVAREVCRRSGWEPLGAEPWAVRDELPARLRASARLERVETHPDGAFYARQNPGYADGTMLAVYAPMGLREVLLGAAHRLGLGSPRDAR